MGVVLGFIDFFLKTRIGNALGLLMIACLALMAWTHHVESKAAAKAVTKVVTQVTKATDSEHDRRIDALVQTQAEMQKSLTVLHRAEARNGRLLKEIDDASHAHDHEPCLSADAVRRLRAIH
jgi:hypothetical protein